MAVLRDDLGAINHYATREHWAGIHAERISKLLDTPALAEVPQRIWRMRFWDDDGDMIVATLAQNISVQAPNPQTWIPRIVGMVFRPYTRAVGINVATVRLELGPGYSADEIVAFYRLDLVDPATCEWRDETKYVLAGPGLSAVLGSMRRND